MNISSSLPLASNSRPTASAAPAPSTPPSTPPSTLPKESLFKRAEEEVADVMDFFGKFGPLHTLGVKLYGMFSKVKQNGPALSNTGMVSPTLERGAQPTDAGFAQLAQQGVKTVINLRPEQPGEGKAVQAAGMKYIFMPLPPVGPPSIQQGVDFLKTVTDPANGKVFFHCQHGADRTGAMAAIYHIAHDGWTADQAIAEMPKYGFHQGIEDEKVVFVRQFAQYWASLPPAEKAQVMHVSLNATA